jgi:hypothetical protein
LSLREDLLVLADGTQVLLIKPLLDAGFMESVEAEQLLQVLSVLEGTQTDGATGLTLI